LLKHVVLLCNTNVRVKLLAKQKWILTFQLSEEWTESRWKYWYSVQLLLLYAAAYVACCKLVGYRWLQLLENYYVHRCFSSNCGKLNIRWNPIQSQQQIVQKICFTNVHSLCRNLLLLRCWNNSKLNCHPKKCQKLQTFPFQAILTVTLISNYHNAVHSKRSLSQDFAQPSYSIYPTKNQFEKNWLSENFSSRAWDKR
jgi:hypothetical protein